MHSVAPNQPEKYCFFCVNQMKNVNFKDTQILRRFSSHYAKILPKKRTGLCAKHQRKVALAIKHARIMALMPFVKK